MHAYYLFVDNFSMTTRTINRIEPAPVPAFPANVAIKAFRGAVRGALKERHIDFMAIVAGVFFLGVDRLKHEQQAGHQKGGQFAHWSNLKSSFSPTSNGSRTALCR